MRQRLALASAAVVVFALFYYGGMVNDFTKFHEAATDWISGRAQLYERYGFFYFPWSMVLIAPLALLGLKTGAAAFNTISTASLVFSASEASKGDRRALLVSILSPFSMLVIYMAQWDTLTIAGSFAGFRAIQTRNPWLLGASLVLMATKPTHVWLPALLLLGAAWNWTWLERGKTLAIPAVVGALSFVFAGWDWPLRYRAMLVAEPPRSVNVSLGAIPGLDPSWLPVALVAIPILYWLYRTIRRKLTVFDIVFALVANLLVSVYVVQYHFVHTIPAIAWLAHRSLKAGVAAWVCSVVGFFIFWQHSGSTWNMAYVVSIAVLLLIFSRTDEE